MLFDINMWAILAAGVSGVIIGMVWYAPAVFGNTWMKLAGITDKMREEGKKTMPKMAFLAFVAAVVLAWVMAHFAIIWGAFTIGSALELAFWIWLGFMLPVQLSAVLWEGKSMKYLAITAGYWLVTTMVTAIIVSLWV